MLPEHDATARRRETILVVEDESIIRFDISDYFRSHGYDVVEANNGEEAIAILNRSPDIAVIFTDVRMPGEIDGIALALYVQEHHPLVPVLITSGHISAEELPALLCPMINKPYSRAYVLQIIEEKLREKKQPNEGEGEIRCHPNEQARHRRV